MATLPEQRPQHRWPRCRSVLMAGTDLSNTGGVRAVVQGYVDGGLFQRFDATYVATHRGGGPWVKATAAVAGWLGIARRLLTMDAPLVHVMMASRASFWRKSVVCLMARLARRPYLLHVHGAEFNQFYWNECGRLRKWFVRYMFANASLVLALTEQWRTDLGRICPTTPIEVLHNAVALPDSRARAQRSARPPTILFLGELGRRKGSYDLVPAFAQVVARRPDARLVCAGDGDLEGVRALAARHGLAERIVCPGWLRGREKDAALAGTTVFVLPSYAEGLPMAVLDAMSWGLPVVTTPVGGVPQVIDHEVNGLLVTPGDVDGIARALLRVLDDEPLRQRLGAAAQATIAARFSLDTALERLAEIYGRFGIAPRGRPSARATYPLRLDDPRVGP